MFVALLALAAGPTIELADVRMVWDAAPHNAFTDLVHHRGQWFCVFREGKAHVSPDGALRVISSNDGVKWESAARLTDANGDLRDAKISVTPDGRLMLLGASALHKPTPHKHQSYTWLSSDGKVWDGPHPVGDAGNWLWRATWRDGTAYGFGYGTGPQPVHVNLYRSRDGLSFDRVAEKVFTVGDPNESAIAYQPDGTAVCLLRRDSKPYTAQIGTAKPPYTNWVWKDLGVRAGGPSLIRLPSGRFVAVVRLYDSKVRTSVCDLDPVAATLTERLTLPSGGDCSYAGLVWHEGQLWVSYYSSHEGKSKVYMAKVRGLS